MPLAAAGQHQRRGRAALQPTRSRSGSRACPSRRRQVRLGDGAREPGVPLGAAGQHQQVPRRRGRGPRRGSARPLAGRRDSSAPNTVGSSDRPGGLGEPHHAVEPSWSVRASAVSPSRAASSTSSSGWLAPSRKLKLEWQCSSAYATVARPRGQRRRLVRLALAGPGRGVPPSPSTASGSTTCGRPAPESPTELPARPAGEDPFRLGPRHRRVVPTAHRRLLRDGGGDIRSSRSAPPPATGHRRDQQQRPAVGEAELEPGHADGPRPAPTSARPPATARPRR